MLEVYHHGGAERAGQGLSLQQTEVLPQLVGLLVLLLLRQLLMHRVVLGCRLGHNITHLVYAVSMAL
jgi:hypothetical protein